jgi:hypothetical protein
MTADTLEAAPEKTRRRRQAEGDAPEPDGITELEKFDPDRVDGVGVPANGFPVLIMKGLPAEDAAEEEPAVTVKAKKKGKNQMPPPPPDTGAGPDDDEDDGSAAKAESESRAAYETARSGWMKQEPVAKDALTGTEFLRQQAAWKRWYAQGDEDGLNGTSDGYARWTAKQATPADEDPAETGPALDGEVIKAEAAVYKRDIDTETRRKLAAEGNALPNLSYPIENKEDLGSAATLARSGHGDVAAARRLISRRAKELGVENPLKSDDKVKASKSGKKPPVDGKDGGKPKCPACKGSGTIRDGGMKCPACKGKGKMKTPAAKAEAALQAVQDTVAKNLAAGIISPEAAEKILAEVDKARGASRPLPAEVKPAGKHREPDGTTTVEQLEPQAGLGTDPDPVADKVPASVSAMGKEAPPYSVARMHDAMCAAYGADSVLEAYPALKSVADAIEPSWWQGLTSEAATAGKMKRTAKLAALAEAAEMVKGTEAAALDDAHAYLHKAFSDMYPNEHLSPSAAPVPGKYQRPYLSSGHAAEHAGGSASIPKSEHVPEPEQFQRGLITAGHAADSPGNNPANNPVAPGSPAAARGYYASAAKDQARVALAAMHDHIAGGYPELCPMASSKAVLPPDLGARNVPVAITPENQGGVATMKAAGEGPVITGTVQALEPAITEASIGKMIRKALRKSAAPPLDADALRAVLAEQISALTERYDTQLEGLRKEVDSLGAQPDPALAPLRGALARQPSAKAVPVERRSLIDEANENARKRAVAEEAAYRSYIETLTRSPDPGTREKALAVVEKMSAATAMAA